MPWLPKKTALLAVAGGLLLQAGCANTPTFLSFGTSVAPLPTQTAGAEELSGGQAIKAHLAVAQNLDRSGNEATAIEQYEKVLAHEPNNMQAHRRLAVLYDRTAEFVKADAEYTKLVQAYPRDADVYNDWGYSLYLRNKWTDAEKQFRRALELNQKHERARCNLGLALGQEGRYQEAFQSFREAKLSEADTHCNMAFIFWSQGQLDEAKKRCKAALQTDTANAKAKEMLAELDRPPPPPEVKARSARTAKGERSREKEREAALSRLGVQTTEAPAVKQAAEQQPIYVSPSGTAWVPVPPANPDGGVAAPGKSEQ